MAEQVNELSPDKLVSGFSRTNIWTYLGIAVALHVVVIGATSIPYFMEQMGFGGEPQAAAAPADDEAAEATPEQAPAQAAADTPPPAQAAGSQASEGEPQNPDAPILETLRDTAEPDEIPRRPDDGLGLDIDMTN